MSLLWCVSGLWWWVWHCVRRAELRLLWQQLQHPRPKVRVTPCFQAVQGGVTSASGTDWTCCFFQLEKWNLSFWVTCMEISIHVPSNMLLETVMLEHLDLRAVFSTQKIWPKYLIPSWRRMISFNNILRKDDGLKVGSHSRLRPRNSIGTVSILVSGECKGGAWPAVHRIVPS